MKKQEEAKGPQMIRCGYGDEGCGTLHRVIKVHKESQQVEAENYHPGVRLCLPCCNKLAYDWGIAFVDVDFLMVAKQAARAGKMGEEGTREEVLAILDQAGVKRKERKSWTQAPDAVPVGDR